MAERRRSIHTGHRQRVKDEFSARGLAGWPDHRVLELLLYYATSPRGCERLAHELVERFGSLAGVLDAAEEELCRVPGVGQHTAVLLKLIPAAGARYLQSRADLGEPVRRTEDAYALLEPYFFGARNEMIYLLALDGKNKPLGGAEGGRPAVCRVPGVPSPQRGGVLCVLLRLLPARGLYPPHDTFIEKDSAINEEIDRLRLSATASLLERRDVIVVSSVSCIYGLGEPEDFEKMMVSLRVGATLERDELLKKLVAIRYERNDIAFDRNMFRVRWETQWRSGPPTGRIPPCASSSSGTRSTASARSTWSPAPPSGA